jgi:hypothetical protein
MDISSDQYQSTGNQSGPFTFILYRTMQEIFKRLAGFFTLTEEDRLRAGILYGGRGHDR